MIEYKQDKVYRNYRYKDRYYKLCDLVKVPDCVVNKSTLTQRLNNGINHPEADKWHSVEECIKTPLIETCINKKIIVEADVRIEEAINSPFTKFMMSMPTNDEDPLIMQSIPIR